ncbi:MAG: hypothetical protein QW474_00075 [Candidatus Aenigmatarchaeota archaeon]
MSKDVVKTALPFVLGIGGAVIFISAYNKYVIIKKKGITNKNNAQDINLSAGQKTIGNFNVDGNNIKVIFDVNAFNNYISAKQNYASILDIINETIDMIVKSKGKINKNTIKQNLDELFQMKTLENSRGKKSKVSDTDILKLILALRWKSQREYINNLIKSKYNTSDVDNIVNSFTIEYLKMGIGMDKEYYKKLYDLLGSDINKWFVDRDLDLTDATDKKLVLQQFNLKDFSGLNSVLNFNGYFIQKA